MTSSLFTLFLIKILHVYVVAGIKNTKMEIILFVSSKLIVHRIFMMFEFGTNSCSEKCYLAFQVATEICMYFCFLVLSKRVWPFLEFFSSNTAVILGNSNIIRILCTINFEEKSNVVSILVGILTTKTMNKYFCSMIQCFLFIFLFVFNFAKKIRKLTC